MTPARLLAPLALVAAAVALVVVLASGGESTERQPEGAAATPAATRANTPEPTSTPTARTYTVKPGDTPSGIAERLDVDLDALLAANPDADPAALTVGAELKIP